MENKFTPGPWKVGLTGLTICADKASGILADCRAIGNTNIDVAQANAALIAAAPALLEALERVAECCDKEPENTCVACGKLARAAIAQARKVKP